MPNDILFLEDLVIRVEGMGLQVEAIARAWDDIDERDRLLAIAWLLQKASKKIKTHLKHIPEIYDRE